MAAVDDVRAINAAFYAAHESGDLVAMAKVWENSERVVCTHPGWPILRGWTAVGESWRRIMSGPVQNQFILTNEVIEVIGDVAWVTLDENLISSGGAGTVAATNVFVRDTDGDWHLVNHHGSPVGA